MRIFERTKQCESREDLADIVQGWIDTRINGTFGISGDSSQLPSSDAPKMGLSDFLSFGNSNQPTFPDCALRSNNPWFKPRHRFTQLLQQIIKLLRSEIPLEEIEGATDRLIDEFRNEDRRETGGALDYKTILKVNFGFYRLLEGILPMPNIDPANPMGDPLLDVFHSIRDLILRR